MDIRFLFGWAKEQGIELPMSGKDVNINKLFEMYDVWKKKDGKRGPKSVDKDISGEYNNFVLKDDESIAVYKRISTGNFYELDELFKLPVFKTIEEKIEDNKKKYGYTVEINTPERKQMRKNWVKQFLTGEDVETYPPNGTPLRKEYKATIVVGLPAAGKSTAIANPLSNEQGAFIMDSDEMKKLIPEYKDTNGGAADAVHKESKSLMQTAFDEFVNGPMKGTNIVIPVIGDNAEKLYKIYIKDLHKVGYIVDIAYKKADTKTSANRVLSRAIKTGRLIPKVTIMKYSDSAVRETYKIVLSSNYNGKRVKKSKFSEL